MCEMQSANFEGMLPSSVFSKDYRVPPGTDPSIYCSTCSLRRRMVLRTVTDDPVLRVYAPPACTCRTQEIYQKKHSRAPQRLGVAGKALFWESHVELEINTIPKGEGAQRGGGSTAFPRGAGIRSRQQNFLYFSYFSTSRPPDMPLLVLALHRTQPAHFLLLALPIFRSSLQHISLLYLSSAFFAAPSSALMARAPSPKPYPPPPSPISVVPTRRPKTYIFCSH